MPERAARRTGLEIETTLWELVNTVRDLASSDDEAFDVLEAMLTESRISVRVPRRPHNSKDEEDHPCPRPPAT